MKSINWTNLGGPSQRKTCKQSNRKRWYRSFCRSASITETVSHFHCGQVRLKRALVNWIKSGSAQMPFESRKWIVESSRTIKTTKKKERRRRKMGNCLLRLMAYNLQTKAIKKCRLQSWKSKWVNVSKAAITGHRTNERTKQTNKLTKLFEQTGRNESTQKRAQVK